EIALLVLAADVRLGEGRFDLLLDHPPAGALGGVVALGELEEFLLMGAGADAGLDSHVMVPLRVGKEPAHRLRVGVVESGAAAQEAAALAAQRGHQVALAGVLVLELPSSVGAEALLRA